LGLKPWRGEHGEVAMTDKKTPDKTPVENRAADKGTSDESPIARRHFLLGAGTAVAAGLAPAAPAEAQTPQASPAAPPATEPEPLLTLTATEHAFFVAAADTIIPADELSPSGSECGVATFIDRQLAGAYGTGARLYRDGPFPKGKPELGYQLALTPREFFRAGVAAANDWTRKTYGKELDRLTAPERESALKAMEEGKAQFPGFTSTMFFNALLQITHGGVFRRPDLRWQPPHGLVEDDRLSRAAGHLPRRDQDVLRQEIR
jgi:gluconate 2-dehydrogenase gamma chain